MSLFVPSALTSLIVHGRRGQLMRRRDHAADDRCFLFYEFLTTRAAIVPIICGPRASIRPYGGRCDRRARKARTTKTDANFKLIRAAVQK